MQERWRQFISQRWTRRVFLAGGATGLLGAGVALFVGCGDGEPVPTERVFRTREVDLSTVGKIPQDYIQKGTYTIMDEEVLPRLRVDVPFESGFIYRNRKQADYSANFSLSSVDTRYDISVRALGQEGLTGTPEWDMDFTVTKTQSLNRYRITYGRFDSSTIIDGETATQQEADAIREKMAEDLVKLINASVDKKNIATVSESFNKAVVPSPTASKIVKVVRPNAQ